MSNQPQRSPMHPYAGRFEVHAQMPEQPVSRAQILDERRGVLDVFFLHTELFGDDFPDALLNVFHLLPPSRSFGARMVTITRHASMLSTMHTATMPVVSNTSKT